MNKYFFRASLGLLMCTFIPTLAVDAKKTQCPQNIDLTNPKNCVPVGDYASCRISDQAGGFWVGRLHVGSKGREMMEAENRDKSKLPDDAPVATFLDTDVRNPEGGECSYEVSIGGHKNYGGSLKHRSM